MKKAPYYLGFLGRPMRADAQRPWRVVLLSDGAAADVCDDCFNELGADRERVRAILEAKRSGSAVAVRAVAGKRGTSRR